MDKVWVGIDVGGTKTAVVLASKPPAVLGRVQFPTRPARGPESALRLIQQGIADLLASTGLTNSAIRRLGVSCGSPLDRIRGVIQAPPNLPTWYEVPIKAILEEKFQTECLVENDANAGAVAEHRFGAGKGARNMVFLTMGTGLGAGLIIEGRLYRGANDNAGEVGHIRLTRTGPVGYNKSGSVEGWASGGGIAQLAGRAVDDARRKGTRTLLTGTLHTGKALTAREVGLAARRGDALALALIHSAGRRLGQVLAILADLLNPERIVIGGLALRWGDMILDPARAILQREALKPAAAICQVVPAELGERIGDVAALCVAMGI